MTFEMYTDDEYGYRVAHPADWTVEAEPAGGASFDSQAGSAGAVVYVDVEIDRTLASYVGAFLDDLAADEHVQAAKCLAQRDIVLSTGETGRVLEYTYLSGVLDERWRLAYLFVVADGTGYTLGVDWNNAERFEAVAAQVIESFALRSNPHVPTTPRQCGT